MTIVAGVALECPVCGCADLNLTHERESFIYSSNGAEEVNLAVDMPVYHCSGCGFSFSAENGSEIRHQAVCRHLGVMAPREIISIREGYGLTQVEFASLSGFGKASLARWESGLLIQNQSIDNLLYLLTFQENVNRLKMRDRTHEVGCDLKPLGSNVIPFQPKFRAISEQQINSLKSQAASFELYPSARAS